MSNEFCRRGLNIVGVPKTIDNDVQGTDQTFGFDSAVNTACDALDKIRTTAESHHRAMVVELMGRTAGWLSLHSGIASGGDVILIPEIPFSPEGVCAEIVRTEQKGQTIQHTVRRRGSGAGGTVKGGTGRSRQTDRGCASWWNRKGRSRYHPGKHRC